VGGETGPDDTLSPIEAQAWRIIERSLRRDLPLRRIERRARMRTDRFLQIMGTGLAAGLGLAVAATFSPGLLQALGLTIAVVCVGLAALRSAYRLAAACSHRRDVRRRRLG